MKKKTNAIKVEPFVKPINPQHISLEQLFALTKSVERSRKKKQYKYLFINTK
jgi:hypothetical protein